MENSKLQNFVTPINSRVGVLKQNFEIKLPGKISKSTKSKSTQTVLNSKIQEIILLFNTKISQIVPVNNGTSTKFTTLENPYFQSKQQCVTANFTYGKPTGMSNNMACEKDQGGESEAQSPLVKDTKATIMKNLNFGLHNLLMEQDFDQLSVKEKVLVYTKFLDIFEKDGDLKKHVNKIKKCGEGRVVYEQQTPVKYLVKDLETGSRLIKPKANVGNRPQIARKSETIKVRMFSIAKPLKVEERHRCAQNLKLSISDEGLKRAEQNRIYSPPHNNFVNDSKKNLKANTDSQKQSNEHGCDGSSKARCVPIKRIRRIRPKKSIKKTEIENLESTFSTLYKNRASEESQCDEIQNKLDSSIKDLKFISPGKSKESRICRAEKASVFEFSHACEVKELSSNDIETQTDLSTNESNEVDFADLTTKCENLIYEINLPCILSCRESPSTSSVSEIIHENNPPQRSTVEDNCKAPNATKDTLKNTSLTHLIPSLTSDVKFSTNHKINSSSTFAVNPSNFPRSKHRTKQENYSSHIPLLLKSPHRSARENDRTIMQVIQKNDDICQPSRQAISVQQQFPVEDKRRETSKFWMKTEDFLISLDIYYVEPEKLRLQYETLYKESGNNQKVCFGIDNYKFSIHETSQRESRLSSPRLLSHYWFAIGDVTIQFNGKRLSGQKLKNIFRFLNASALETGVMRFGVDEVEFSNTMEHKPNTQKLSLSSICSHLTSLQRSSENALATCSKAPLSSPQLDLAESKISKKIPVGDDYALSSYPFTSNDFDRCSVIQQHHQLTACNGDAVIGSKESFCPIFKHEPREDKLKSKNPFVVDKINQTTQDTAISKTLSAVERTQRYLRCIQRRLNDYINICNLTSRTLKNYGFIPSSERILGEVNNINNANGLCERSKDELEICMYSLICYVNPPENELQKSHDHNPAALSEHQLRIQASLQRLNIPDWFRQYNQNQSRSPEGAVNTSSYRPGNFTRKRTQDSGRWAGLNSKTTSLSSLGSQRSDRSPLLLSPSAHSHHGGQTSLHTHHIQNANVSAASGGAGTFSRWSTSHLNSSQISPSVSQRGSFSRGGPINSSFMSVSSGHSAIRNSMRQPYMGWRSQEKLSQRTAHERLASSLLAQQQRTSPNTRTTILTSVSNGSGNNKLPPLVTPEIQTSIKEVTSAIVHYVNDQTNQQRSRSTSPNSRKCWLESSFVGTRPLDSPQTPIIENTTFTTAVAAAAAASLLSTTNIASAATTTNNNNNNFHTANHNQYNLNTRQNLPINLFGDEAVLTRMNNGGALNNGTTTYSSVASASGTNLIPNISTGYTGLAAAPERSLSSASLEDVLTSLLGLSTTTTYTTTATVTSGVTLATDATATYARSSTGDAIASEAILAANDLKHMPQNIHQQTQPSHPEYEQQKENIQQHQLQVLSKEDQQRLRRRSEGDAPTQKSKQLQQNQKLHQYAANANVKTAYASDSLTTLTHSSASSQPAANNVNIIVGTGTGSSVCLAPRRVSLGDSSESNNKTISAASGELQIKCRNTKCDRNATPADAKKYYKSCHNCTYLYCSRECRRAHWEKHRKACLHSRASNLCRQVLATCKDDLDSQRHLSLMARKGYLSQGRGVVRILFRSAEAAEGFIKHGFQCLGEASYVRWPDLMPAEMGLELYSELLRFSTEYKPESKMLIYVAICVVSEAPGMGQAPVRWERQLVSRCAKLKLCKSVLAELEQPSQPTSGILQQQQQQLSQPITMITVPEPTTEVLILTFNPQLRTSTTQRELVFSNILNILSRRGVVLRRHYPEIFQRLQSFAEGQTDKFNPVTLHPRNSQTGQNFVCIIMPVHSESEIIKLPSAADGGNRVTTIDVGSQAALAQLDDDELLMRTSS
uniref:MYND-type domain-containing protein n=1 Tax=Glossina brevipalpis TaxID=37001 RepID=A0A1A9X077_9MUSC